MCGVWGTQRGSISKTSGDWTAEASREVTLAEGPGRAKPQTDAWRGTQAGKRADTASWVESGLRILLGSQMT